MKRPIDDVLRELHESEPPVQALNEWKNEVTMLAFELYQLGYAQAVLDTRGACEQAALAACMVAGVDGRKTDIVVREVRLTPSPEAPKLK